MLKSFRFAASFILAAFLFASISDAQKVSDESNSKTAEKKAATPSKDLQISAAIVGSWRVRSITIVKDGNEQVTESRAEEPTNMIIAEKKLTLRMGTNVISEMQYELDQKQMPWHLDVKSADGAMSGICRLQKNQLELRLNEGETRPADFDNSKCNMKLVLRRFPSMALFVIDSDGKNLHKLAAIPEYSQVGSPRFSPDSSKIVCDGWKSVMGERLTDAHVLQINSDGSGFKDLGRGATPNWSPDGKQFLFSQYGENKGIWTMAADGTSRKAVDVGWGARWSNKSNDIAYVSNDTGGTNIYINNLSTGEKRTLLDKKYAQINWGTEWSPDDRRICFYGTLPDRTWEIAKVAAEGEGKGFKVILSQSTAEPRHIESKMSWGGPEHQILVSTAAAGNTQMHISLLDPEGAKPMRFFPGVPAELPAQDATWSRGGKKVVFAAVPTN